MQYKIKELIRLAEELGSLVDGMSSQDVTGIEVEVETEKDGKDSWTRVYIHQWAEGVESPDTIIVSGKKELDDLIAKLQKISRKIKPNEPR